MTEAIVPTVQTTLGQIRVVSCADGRATIEYEVGRHMCHPDALHTSSEVRS